MQVIETVAEMKRLRRNLSQPVGLVPTMGYLHEGHLSLVRQARRDNASLVASIFVNPTQFGPQEDLQSYPRDIERDLAWLEKEATDTVFMPPAAEMYPPRFDSWVEVGTVSARLEGASRPGHFKGVATVCAKLFNIIEPTRAYFGQKDAQQVAVIKKMVADLNMNLEIVTLPTVREPDGLAMSSRNSYLNAEERRAATVLYLALKLAQDKWAQGGTDAGLIRREMAELIGKQPLAAIDYISISHAETLDELEIIRPPALVSLAVRFGQARLIDNIVLE
jgi:pantoate--beta-alanine ligase